MKRLVSAVLGIFLAVAGWVGFAAGGGIPMPFRIGGTVTLDGLPITQANDDGLVLQVTKANGSPYTDASGKPPEDKDGLSAANWYLIDVPIRDAVEQPGGATQGEQAALQVTLNGAVCSVVNPPGGLFTVGESGTNQQINVVAQSASVVALTVVSPNGGESWPAGSDHTIQWTYTGDPGAMVKIELLKAGVVVSTITAGTAVGGGGNGSYGWTIPGAQALGTDYRIKISSTTVAGCSDTSDSNFAITQAPADLPNLRPYKPSAWSGKIVVAKTPDTYTEDSPLSPTDNLYVAGAVINNGTALVGAFRVRFFVDGEEKNSWLWTDGLNPNYYWYFYNQPLGTLSAGTHSLKIVADSEGAITEADESDNEFTRTITILDDCTLTVTSPNGGENWEAGTQHAIQWSYTGDPGAAVKIRLLQAGKAVKTIAASAPVGASGSGSFTWKIPAGLLPADNYKIKVNSTTQTSCQDSSNKVFSVFDGQDIVPLASGKGVTGSVSKGVMKYYKITAPISSAQFKVKLTNVTGDPELLVKKNSKPTSELDYDAASKHLGKQPESITQANPDQAIWYIGVYGYKASTYTIKAELSADQTVALTSGKAVASSVALGDWQYYRITTPADTAQLKVTLTKLSADVDLYLRKASRPQQFEYNKRSIKVGTLSETITIKNPGESVWYIGAYGSAKGKYTVKAVLTMPLGGEQPLEEETPDF